MVHDSYPARLDIDYPEKLDRLTTFFRFIWAIPILIILTLISPPSTHAVSRCLTSLAPQPPHKTLNRCCPPWSRRFDRIFRNEGVGGSNPPSSTKNSWSEPFLTAPSSPI